MAAAAEAILDSLKDKKVAVGGIFVVAESARYTHWLSNDELGKIIAAHGGKPQLAAINSATDVVILGDIGARDIKCVGAPRARARARTSCCRCRVQRVPFAARAAAATASDAGTRSPRAQVGGQQEGLGARGRAGARGRGQAQEGAAGRALRQHRAQPGGDGPERLLRVQAGHGREALGVFLRARARAPLTRLLTPLSLLRACTHMRV